MMNDELTALYYTVHMPNSRNSTTRLHTVHRVVKFARQFNDTDEKKGGHGGPPQQGSEFFARARALTFAQGA
jgi:hypothetical protein